MAILILSTAHFVPQLLNAQIDPNNRWEVRDFYNSVYFYGNDAEMSWTGDYATSDSGTVSPEWLDATVVRINFFREMAGIPADVTLDPALNAKCQDSAMIISANVGPGKFDLNHFPPSNWIYWTQDGYDAAGNGNIAFGSTGAESVTAYMVDSGVSNFNVGHRRWLLFPPTEKMGSGDTPSSDIYGYVSANTIWVQDIFSPRPATRDSYIAWPPRGYVPSDMVWSRWSITYPNADFSNAIVTMTMGGSNIPLVLEPYTFSFGSLPESTLVWVPDGRDTNQRVNWPTPVADETIDVSVSNVMIDGNPQSFDYSVTIFDSNSAGNEEFSTTLTPPAEIGTGVPVNFTATTRPGWSEEIEGRVIEKETYAVTHDAEGATNSFIDDTDGTYDEIQSSWVANGAKSFLLQHTASPFDNPQILTVPDRFVVTSNSPTLSFNSSLSLVGDGQVASVDIKTDNDADWHSIWSVIGGVGQIVSTFSPINIDLSPWEGAVAQFRIRFDFTGGSYFNPQGGFNVGWAFDDVIFSGINRITNTVNLAPVGGDTISHTFTSTNSVYLQAREYAFGGFALDWGTLLEVTPTADGFSLAGTTIGSWTEHPTVGWIYGVTAEWIYSIAMGWINVERGSWLYTNIGWAKYVSGNLDSGLWLYSPAEGFIYLQSSQPGKFLRSPFTGEPATWGSFHS